MSQETLILNNFIFGFLLTLSIGISDAIELYFNPYIHQIHNMPDCYSRTMHFKDYRWWHAGYTGIQASWFLIFLALFPIRLPITNSVITGFINITIPIIMYVTRIDRESPSMGHLTLYVFNTTSIVFCLIKKSLF